MIPYSTQLIDQSDIDAVVSVLKSSNLTQGKEVEKFEQALCQYINAQYAITFNSATSALLAAYSISGIVKNDEIITTPISFVATTNMAIAVGAKPVFCDIKLDGNIDEHLIESLITKKTKAIVPVDFSGKPVELDSIISIAKKHDLLVIEDASHALGSSYKDKKIGSISDMSIFSFHAIKPITTGEGGAILTNNKEMADKLRLFRSHGMIKKNTWDSDMVDFGYNLRLTDIAAALGSSQLKKLDNFIQQRNKIANYYDSRFKNTSYLNTVKINDHEKSSHHLYPILLNTNLCTYKKEILQELHKKGIGVQVHYKPIYQNTYYKKNLGKMFLNNAELFYNSEISLPCHQKMSIDEAKFIAGTLSEILEQYTNFGKKT